MSYASPDSWQIIYGENGRSQAIPGTWYRRFYKGGLLTSEVVPQHDLQPMLATAVVSWGVVAAPAFVVIVAVVGGGDFGFSIIIKLRYLRSFV